MFANLGQLKDLRFEFISSRKVAPLCATDEMIGCYQLEWFSSNMHKSHSLREVTLDLCIDQDEEFQALKLLMAGCRVSLNLRLTTEDADLCVPFLCDGIEAAASMPSLNLQISDDSLEDEHVVDLLQTLQGNRSIRDLVFTVNEREMVGPAMQGLVANNSTLKTLGIEANTEEAKFIIRGLKHNRQLEVLEFTSRWSPVLLDKGTSAELVDVLRNHNTALSGIKGLLFKSKAHRKEIEWLLSLNRYTRHLLADPGRVTPRGLWAHVLGRVRRDGRADVMYHLVNALVRRNVALSAEESGAEGQNLPHWAVRRERRPAGSRKRRR
jgi:hypothetical protein